MNASKTKWFLLLVLLTAALIPSSVFAQVAEINPYAGFIWPGTIGNFGEFENNQLLGARGGYYITPNFELGGNYSWNNHFQPKVTAVPPSFAGELGFPQGKSRAHLWEAEFTYNFGKRSLFGSTVKPYVVGGAGGLTTSIKDPSEFVLNVRPTSTRFGTPVFVANDVLRTSETFFTFSYGGGLKAERLVGPVGFFGDIRGRTIPNFFSDSFTWPEVSAGLTFAWGAR